MYVVILCLTLSLWKHLFEKGRRGLTCAAMLPTALSDLGHSPPLPGPKFLPCEARKLSSWFPGALPPLSDSLPRVQESLVPPGSLDIQAVYTGLACWAVPHCSPGAGIPLSTQRQPCMVSQEHYE